MRQLILITSFLLSGLALSQNLTVAEVQEQYPTLFSAEINMRGGKAYFAYDVDDLPKDHQLAGLFNDHKLYVDYLLQNYLSLDWQSFKGYTKDDEEAFRRSFYEALATDSVFNTYFLEQVDRYLRSKGGELEGHQLHEPITLSADGLAMIGSRFFYATSLGDNGKINWNICVGKNAYHNTSKENMLPLVEAFCFFTIFKSMGSDEDVLMDVMRASAEKLHENKGDREGEEKLLYYREGMFDLMGRSSELKQVLLDAYEQKKEMLNFRLL